MRAFASLEVLLVSSSWKDVRRVETFLTPAATAAATAVAAAATGPATTSATPATSITAVITPASNPLRESANSSSSTQAPSKPLSTTPSPPLATLSLVGVSLARVSETRTFVPRFSLATYSGAASRPSRTCARAATAVAVPRRCFSGHGRTMMSSSSPSAAAAAAAAVGEAAHAASNDGPMSGSVVLTPPVKEIVTMDEAEGGPARAALQVDGAFVGFVIGKGGQNLKDMEQSTGATIKITDMAESTGQADSRSPQFSSVSPSSPRGGSRKKRAGRVHIDISGPNKKNVEEAKQLILHVVDEAIEGRQLDYSHFVSLPLAAHPYLVAKLTELRDSVLLSSPRAAVEGQAEARVEGAAAPAAVHVEGARERRGGQSGSQVEGSMAVLTLAREDEEDEGVCQGKGACEGEMTGLEEGEEWEQSSRDSQGKRGGDGGGRHHKRSKKKLAVSESGIDASIFVKPATLHLTVQMLKLWNQERVEAAAAALKSALPAVLEALQYKPLVVRVAGLRLMKGSPAKAHVLYAAVEDGDSDGAGRGSQERMMKACEILRSAMREAGLVTQKDQREQLKLHATLINTSHRKRLPGHHGRRFPFDARNILDRHGDADWGTHVIGQAHLSQRYVFDEDGYYHCCLSIDLPKEEVANSQPVPDAREPEISGTSLPDVCRVA